MLFDFYGDFSNKRRRISVMTAAEKMWKDIFLQCTKKIIMSRSRRHIENGIEEPEKKAKIEFDIEFW